MSKATVMIFAYDREQFLSEAVNSVTSQLDNNSDVEVIVSTCFTVSLKFKKEIEYGQIKFVEFPKGIKYGEQFVKTFEISTGDIIFILEDDDLFLPWKIERSLAIFRISEDVMFIKDKVERFTNRDRHSIISEIPKKNHSDFDFVKIENNYSNYKIFSKIQLWGNPSSMVFRRKIIEINKDLILCNEPMDVLLGIAILNYGGYCVLYNYPLTLIRRHELNDTISLLSVKDQTGFNAWRRTQSKYVLGMKCALKSSKNFHFYAKTILMRGIFHHSVSILSSSQTNAIEFLFKLTSTCIIHFKEVVIETNKNNFDRLETLKWYFLFGGESIIFSLSDILYFIHAKSFNKSNSSKEGLAIVNK
ncbi:MAG: glycosyltransferase [Thermoplasmatales archaeon]